jgi:TrmH family RNA methyltransferase
LTLLDGELFDAIEQLPSSTGIMALVALPESVAPAREGCCLLLDGVQDPGNVGTILRTAAAAGVAQVWLTPGCADVWSPKVVRAGMGAHFLLPLLERIDAPSALAAFQGPLAITTLDATQSIYDTQLSGPLVLALGSEGAGVSEPLAALAGLRLRIPMAAGVESLNVSAAAAVCLFERLRQSLK